MTPVRPSPALQWTNLNFGRVRGITHKAIINHLYIAISFKGWLKVGGEAQPTEFKVLIWYLNSFNLILNPWPSSSIGNKSLSLSSSEAH